MAFLIQEPSLKTKLCMNVEIEFYFYFQTKAAGPKLIPFFKAVCVYFLLNAHNQNGEYWTTVLKCAPIIGLILFILLHGAHVLNKFVAH